MPFPENVLDKLTREHKPTPGWSGRLLTLSLIVFAASIALYSGLTLAWQPYLRSRIDALKTEAQRTGSEISASDQGHLAAFYFQLANIKALLARHIFISPLFAWLERTTGKNIYFSKLDLNTASQQLVLTGVGRTTRDVAEQIAAFENEPDVRQATLRTMSPGKAGLWEFDLFLSLNPTFFKE